MNLIYHFIVSVILAILLFPIYQYQALLVFISGFFIDIDHYFYSIFKDKSFNIMKSYTYFKDINSVRIDTLAIFHVVEFWVLIVALFIIFKNDFFYPLLISLVIHIILDIIREKVKHTEGERAHSLIFWLKRRNLI